MRSIILLCLILLMFGCQSSQKDKNPLSKNVVKQTQAKIKKVHLDTVKKEFSELSKEEWNSFVKGSRIGRTILVSLEGNVLSIISDGSLTHSILGRGNSLKDIQQRFGDIFEVEEQWIASELYNEKQLVEKLVFNDSFIKIYSNPETQKIDIVSALIRDPQISLEKGIRIGQSKQEFFEIIFSDAKKYDFSQINTLDNGDEMGEKQQFFIFKNNKLEEVILKSDYEWIPFDLD